jgi:bifunctional DNA-binding transcriptional regulator/antitoxin component of YhaV-PrlF toxin-antitoxin module
MKVVSIVRNRGQLTIPDAIRKFVPWVNAMSAVTISVVEPDSIVIKPHVSVYEWKAIWAGIKKARAVRGKKKGISAVKFLEKDRRSH